MKRATLAAATLFLTLSAAAQQSQDVIRNTFATAAENVIDNANSLDLKAESGNFDPRMTQLKAMKDNLNTMAEGTREHDVVTAVNDILYTLSACRIQAIDGADIAPCQTRLQHATARAMTALSKHKTAGTWTDGPPS